MSTPVAAFGPGILIGTRTDLTTPIAINVGFVQEFSIEAAATQKSLYGQNQWPLVSARGTIKGTGKFKNAVVSGIAMNALYFGMTASTATNLSWQIASTFTTSTTALTVQIGSSLTFDTDLGIVYGTTAASPGLPLQRVTAGSEAQGKYSITSAGLVTIVSADQGVPIKATFTQSTTGGQVIPVTNQLIGTTPSFQLDYYTNLNQPTSKPVQIRLFSCVADKLSFQFKLEDFMIPEIDYSLYANAGGQVFNIYFPSEVS